MKVELFAHHIHSCPLNLDDCQGLISMQRLTQIQCRQPEDQLRSLSGDLLVRYALQRSGYSCTMPLRYKTNEYGKPFLSDYPEVHFNFSHSGDWTVCAVAPVPIGVDIQQERPVKPALLRYALSEQELSFILSLPEGQQQSTFFDLWCLKEADSKAKGLGLTQPLKSIQITPLDLNQLRNGATLRLLPSIATGYHLGIACSISLPHHIPIHIIPQIV